MSESSPIVVTFDWQPGEHAEVVKIISSQQWRHGGWRVLRWAVGFLGIGWTVLSVAELVMDGTAAIFFGGLPWLLFIAFWWWLLTRGLGNAAARQTSLLTADVHYPFAHRFDDEGLRIDGFGSSVELRWRGMARATEEDGFFLFYWNTKCAYFTPKRTMSIEDQNRLRTLAERHLGADARMRDQIEPVDHRQLQE